MKKLYAFFLYLMLAVLPARAMVTNFFLMTCAPLIGKYIWDRFTVNGESLNDWALSDAKNKIMNFFGSCRDNIDYFGGDKCGIWKSREQIRRETAESDFQIRLKNREAELKNEHAAASLERDRQFLEERQQWKTNFEVGMKQNDEKWQFILNKKNEEIDALTKKVQEFTAIKIFVDQSVEKDRKHAEEIANLNAKNEKLSQTLNNLSFNNEIEGLKKKLQEYKTMCTKLTKEKETLEKKIKEYGSGGNTQYSNWEQPFAYGNTNFSTRFQLQHNEQ